MSRGQQQAVIDQSSKENKAYNTDANTSFTTAQQDITGYGDELAKFKANNPYVQGGVAQTAENQQLADTAAGIAQAGGQAVQGAAVRTGQNPGGAIAATEEMAREGQRTLAPEEAAATERRLAAGTGYQEAGLEGTAQVESMQDKLAREQGELAAGALNTDASASTTPSFGDVLGDSFGQSFGSTVGKGAGLALMGACPARRSMFLMSDGTEIPIEDVGLGDSIAGEDGEAEKVTAITIVRQPVLRVETANGLVTRNSLTHCFICQLGWVLAAKSLGVNVKTSLGISRVIGVRPDGEELVFSIETDGSHTYRADGVWAYGVGHAPSDAECDEYLKEPAATYV